MGYSKLVGEAFKEHAYSFAADRPVVLGVADWGAVRSREILTAKQDFVEYELSGKTNVNEMTANLDPYHSHFLLVDDARVNSFGGEMLFRSRLEAELSRGICEKAAVVLVVGGGRNTVVQVDASVRNMLPCVFFDGTGKFANVFAFILKGVERKQDLFDAE
jgi:hypothetical protein